MVEVAKTTDSEVRVGQHLLLQKIEGYNVDLNNIQV